MTCPQLPAYPMSRPDPLAPPLDLNGPALVRMLWKFMRTHRDFAFNTEVYAKRTVGYRAGDVTVSVPRLFSEPRLPRHVAR